MGDPGLVVVHAIPGRLRLRVPPGARTDGLAEAIATGSGIVACTWSPRTRSLLVHYDPTVVTETGVVRAVAEHVGVDVAEDVPSEAVSAPRPGGNHHSPLGRAVVQAFGEMNQRVAQATHGTLDLGMAFPLALAAWALAELMRGRTAPLAWSSALWYAHGLFRDYNTPQG